jgi:DUF971 family protein
MMGENAMAAGKRRAWRKERHFWRYSFPPINGNVGVMQPVDIQIIGPELAVKWDDGTESFIALEALRRHCPCAGCKGEMDVMGNLYKGPEQVYTDRSFQLLRVVNTGGYAIQPIWADGHATGLYTFGYLRKVAAA